MQVSLFFNFYILDQIMIFLSLGLASEHIVPRQKKMDRIDRMLIMIIKICLVVLFVTLPQALADDEPGDDFWLSCSSGKIEAVSNSLEQHPSKSGFHSILSFLL